MSTATTKERTEMKFEVAMTAEELPALWRDIARHIPMHEYVPGRWTTHNNTLYFDSPDCRLLKDGLVNRFDHLRIRARKYEYEPALEDGSQDYWLELKRREGEIRRKERFLLRRQDLEGLLAGDPCGEGVLERNRGQLDLLTVYRDIQQLVLDLRLEPFTLASYNRVAFEGPGVRLSVDWDIRYHAADRSTLRVDRLKDLPDPAGRESTAVLELKYIGEVPLWLAELQAAYPIAYRTSFSKCDRGTKALLQGPLRVRPDASLLLQMLESLKHEDTDDD